MLSMITGPAQAHKTTTLLDWCHEGSDTRYFSPRMDEPHKIPPTMSYLIPYSLAWHTPPDTVLIDDIHLYSPTIVEAIQYLHLMGVSVIVAGHWYDANGDPFPTMERLAAYSDNHHKITSSCYFCHSPTTHTMTMHADEGIDAPVCLRCQEHQLVVH